MEDQNKGGERRHLEREKGAYEVSYKIQIIIFNDRQIDIFLQISPEARAR